MNIDIASEDKKILSLFTELILSIFHEWRIFIVHVLVGIKMGQLIYLNSYVSPYILWIPIPLLTGAFNTPWSLRRNINWEFLYVKLN